MVFRGLNGYKDTVCPDGICAKLGVRCRTIGKFKELLDPLAADIAEGYGLPLSTPSVERYPEDRALPQQQQ